MTTKDLFRCIGNLSDDLLEEAAAIRRKPRWLPIAALAACAVLAVSIPLAVRGIGANKSASTDTSAAETPTMEAPADLPEEEAAAEDPGTRGEASGGWQDSDPIDARILSAALGDLRLGMTSGEVAALIGGPDSFSNSGAVERADELQEICWFYNTSGSADVLHDASLTLVGDDVRDGPDAVLSSIWITSPCTWTLDTGIGIGSTRDEVLSAYPDAQLESDTADGVAVDRNWEQFYYRAGDLYLTITLRDEAVASIELGGLNADPDPDAIVQPEADPYTFTPYETLSGETVTAYTRTENGWEGQMLTGAAAKRIVTTLNITDPEPGDAQGEPVLWLEFESGGVLALYNETGAGAIYRLEDQTAFETALAAGRDPSPALTLIEGCVFPDAWEDVMQALDEPTE